jgi:hypothetical protein
VIVNASCTYIYPNNWPTHFHDQLSDGQLESYHDSTGKLFSRTMNNEQWKPAYGPGPWCPSRTATTDSEYLGHIRIMWCVTATFYWTALLRLSYLFSSRFPVSTFIADTQEHITIPATCWRLEFTGAIPRAHLLIRSWPSDSQYHRCVSLQRSYPSAFIDDKGPVCKVVDCIQPSIVIRNDWPSFTNLAELWDSVESLRVGSLD